MKRIKFFALGILILLLGMMLFGCGRMKVLIEGAGENEVATSEALPGIYWIDQGETRIVKMPYSADTSSPEALIGSCIAGLSQTPEDTAYKSVISGNVKVNDYTYESSNKLATVYFDESYRKLSEAREVLTRAAVVKTLTQFSDEIQYVSFMIGDEALTAKDGSLMLMKGRDFLSAISGNMEYVKEDYVTLYFATGDRKMLQAEDVVIKYLSKINLETAVVNSLITGPISRELKPVLPSDIGVNKVNVKEGVCYVDLDKTFLERIEGQSFELNVYAIVNSLTQIAGISRVQFLIDGVTFDGEVEGMRIDGLFEKNMNLVYRPEKKPLETKKTPVSEDEEKMKPNIEQQILENQAALATTRETDEKETKTTGE